MVNRWWVRGQHRLEELNDKGYLCDLVHGHITWRNKRIHFWTRSLIHCQHSQGKAWNVLLIDTKYIFLPEKCSTCQQAYFSVNLCSKVTITWIVLRSMKWKMIQQNLRKAYHKRSTLYISLKPLNFMHIFYQFLSFWKWYQWHSKWSTSFVATPKTRVNDSAVLTATTAVVAWTGYSI